ncbi:MAG: hypothetical protein ABL931_07860, partial [Usitatibacteraceae bacterium]
MQKIASSSLSLLILALGSNAFAQTAPLTPSAAASPSGASAAARAKPCLSIENRQFDFWIGDWDVTTPDGKLAGTNLIKPILAGCVLHENW